MKLDDAKRARNADDLIDVLKTPDRMDGSSDARAGSLAPRQVSACTAGRKRWRRWPLSLTAAALSLATARAALGGEDGEGGDMRVLPCRPTISCSADIVPPGAVEIEAGYAARFVRVRGLIHSEPFLLKLTLVRWLQAQAGSNGLLFTTGDVSRSLYYFDDFTFALKTHFADQSSIRPSMAASDAVNVPSFDRSDTFPFAYDASFWAYASKDFGAPGETGSVHVDLNGGVNVWQFDIPQRSVQTFGTLAVSTALAWHLGVMWELYGFTDAGRIAPKDSGLLMGLSYSPLPTVMFDLGGDVSVFPSTRKFTLFFGVTFIPFRLWG
jgi:hypothetical protein